MESVANIGVKEADKSLTITQEHRAPRNIVFKAFSEAEHLRRWWGPKGWDMPVCEVDFRPGGEWVYAIENDDGEIHWAKAVYQEIVPNEKIVFLANFIDGNRKVLDELPEQKMTITFDEQDEKTFLTILVEYSSAKDKEQHVEMGFIQGFSQALGQFAGLVNQLTK